MLAELVEVNVTAETIFALSLFPLVWIAWADGGIEEEESNAILAAAHSRGHERDTASHQLIESWLVREPDAKILQAWKDYVHALCQVLSSEAVGTLKQDILARTRQVAEAAGGILGFHKVSCAGGGTRGAGTGIYDFMTCSDRSRAKATARMNRRVSSENGRWQWGCGT